MRINKNVCFYLFVNVKVMLLLCKGLFFLTQDGNQTCLNEIQMKVYHNFLRPFPPSAPFHLLTHTHTDRSPSPTFHFPYQSASSWLLSTLFCLQTSVQWAPSPSSESLHKWNPHLWSQMQKKLINTSVSSRLDYCNALLPGKCPSKAPRQGCQAADEGAGGGDKKPLHLSFTHFAGFLSMLEFNTKSLHLLLQYVNKIS